MVIRKGDIVAVQQFKRTTYAFLSGIPSDSYEEWSLALVTSASREGFAKIVQFQRATPTKLDGYHGGKPKVWTLIGKQDEARRLYDGEPQTWTTGEELKAAIVSQCVDGQPSRR